MLTHDLAEIKRDTYIRFQVDGVNMPFLFSTADVTSVEVPGCDRRMLLGLEL